ncbi:MAG: hypothetical protein IID45_10760, partial [Planctomycetes bacterium]|nr:hypothetical protein [Planctomycetota bacterium]
RHDHKPLPPSPRRQLTEQNGKLVLRGWMQGNQKKDLIKYKSELEWQAAIEKLFDAAQPKPPLKGKISYYIDHRALSFEGYMTEKQKKALLALGEAGTDAWKTAVESLYEQSHQAHSIPLEKLPDGVSIPKILKESVRHKDGKLVVDGPMTAKQRDQLGKQFLLARPLQGDKRAKFLAELQQQGDQKLNEDQLAVFKKVLDGGWTVGQLKKTLSAAGKVKETDKTATEMLKEKNEGVRDIKLKKKEGRDMTLTPEHEKLFEQFAENDQQTLQELIKALDKTNEKAILGAFSKTTFAETAHELAKINLFTDAQKDVLKKFADMNPTVGERKKQLGIALLQAGPLSVKQRKFLFQDYQRERDWQKTAGRLFLAAHTTKYAWSGAYREQGAAFWWLYEYAFKPLTATMFAMLAFYVASAAFRAFRAKNTEAILLLGTAFIILLARTAAGGYLTDWIPEEASGLRMENLTQYIMTIFNTAGNRAIMIGIALGIASTSLKVLLGVERSYLGSSND